MTTIDTIRGTRATILRVAMTMEATVEALMGVVWHRALMDITIGITTIITTDTATMGAVAVQDIVVMIECR